MRAIITICFSLLSMVFLAQAIPVTMELSDGQWQLVRQGKPYFIKGTGGHTQMDVAVECGANSIRTWGTENAKAVLDEAHSKGLTVMMGFWMGHERHGFSYSDEWAVTDQFKRFRKTVRELKDHPALLMWGVGNEMDLFYSDFNVWDAVEDIAKMIHEEDPNHPTCVVTAGIDVAEVQMIQKRAPSIDILGVNTYGGLSGVPRMIDLYGWKGPYIITEWGPNGHWEVANTEWGSPIEQSSYEKARVYEERYEKYILGDQEQCIGAYVFHWGQKQETTATWYGMFLEDGTKTESIDVVTKLWSGSWPENRCPQILKLTVDGKTKHESVRVLVGKKYPIEFEVTDPDGDPLRIEWEIVPESMFTKSGGDTEQKPKAVQGTFVVKLDEGKYQLKVPRSSGPYRLFAYAYDEHGHAATYNVPFYIDRAR